MYIKNDFNVGQTVYLKTDPDQLRRIVEYLTVFKEDDIMYDLGCGTSRSSHYPFEISDVPDQNIKLGIEDFHTH